MNAATTLRIEELGRIEPEAQRFYHVINHVFVRDERWDLVCPKLAANPRGRALAAGCERATLSPRFNRFELAGSPCRAHVLGVHDECMEPAYRAAFAWAATHERLAVLPDSSGRTLLAVGEQGVMVVLRRGDHGWRVASAYRVTPRAKDGPLDEPRAFFKAAVRKWKDKTSTPSGANR